MLDLASGIDETIKNFIPGHGFTLIIFPFNNVSVANYISNAAREDIIVNLREMADMLEKKD
jgi:hypothetical protein